MNSSIITKGNAVSVIIYLLQNTGFYENSNADNHVARTFWGWWRGEGFFIFEIDLMENNY